MKTCKKGLHQYDSSKKGGCPECKRIYCAQWHRENSEKCNALTRQWHRKNKRHSIQMTTDYFKTLQGKKSLRKRELKRKYGITPEQYEQLLKNQNGTCAICHQLETAKWGEKIKVLTVDHSHASNKIRGLLCQRCNIGLGQFRDNPELLRAAITYLSTFTK